MDFIELKSRYLIIFISVVLISGLSLYLLYRSSRITEKSEYEARHNKLKFQQLVEFAPDAMVVCRPDGSIVLINKQAERLFQYQHNELVGRPVSILVPKEYREQHDSHIKSYVGSPMVRPMGVEGMELHGLRKDGSEFPVSISLSPIDSGKDMLIATAIREVSAVKRPKSKKKQVA
jgi:PAS domain S-box-containing protein